MVLPFAGKRDGGSHYTMGPKLLWRRNLINLWKGIDYCLSPVLTNIVGTNSFHFVSKGLQVSFFFVVVTINNYINIFKNFWLTERQQRKGNEKNK